MPKIVFTGRTEACSYSHTPLFTQLDWLKNLEIISLDTETNVTDSILNRQLKVISIADIEGKVMWVIEFNSLTTAGKVQLMSEIIKKLCIIQNVSFDYQVFKKYGFILERVYDTMLAEQVLTNGYAAEQGFHGLQAIYKRRFDIDISKDEQTSFGSDTALTDTQIRYSAVDVYKLGTIRKLQMSEMHYEDKRIGQAGNKGLRKTMWWENEFSKVVADSEYAGVFIDKEKWFTIEDEVQPIWDAEFKTINDIVISDFYDILEANDWISDKDRMVVNIWSSSAKKIEILSHVFDFPILKTSQVELKKLLQENDPNFPPSLKLSGKSWESSDYPRKFDSVFSLIKLLILYSKNKEKIGSHLDKVLMADNSLRKFCIEKKWLVPANQITLKWSSPIQRIKIFQAVDVNIDSTSKDVIVDYIDSHRIIAHYLEWARVDFIKKSFGKSFYEKYVDLDGRFRTRIRQILATGRLSSTSPNLLAIPHAKVYRKCFTIQFPNEILIGADYDGEELNIAGTLSGQQNWIDAFKQGLDLHSINAEIIFGSTWVDSAEEDCTYYYGSPVHKRCNCEEHDDLRTKAKTLEFGQIYGMGAASLGAKLKIPKSEAQELIDSFLGGLPQLTTYMTKIKDFTIANGYIIEPVMGRIRYYDKWKFTVEEEIAGIERASVNYTIQASGSAILKIFAVLLRRWINHHNLQDAIRILLLVHDEVLLSFRPDKLTDFNVINTEQIKQKVEHYMILAAKLGGFPYLNAKAAHGQSWGETHN